MPVQIQGQTYLTVAERLASAHAYEPWGGIRSVDTTIEAVGALVLAHAIVTFGNGNRYHGVAEVTAGNGRGPQAQAPVETAQTSAVGRALALALWPGSDRGLAGAEEVLEAQARPARSATPAVAPQAVAPAVVRPAPAPAPVDELDRLRWSDDDEAPAPVAPAPAPAPARRVLNEDGEATPAQLQTIEAISRQLGRRVDLVGLTRGEASLLIDDLYAQRRASGAGAPRRRA